MKYLPSSNWCTYCTAHGIDPEAPGASEGLRRPCALSSGKDIRVWKYLRSSPINQYTDNNRQQITSQPDRCVRTIDNVEPVFGGLWARNVSIGRRAVVTGKGGTRSYSQVRLTDPEQSMHARDTWQHADRYRTVTVPLPYRYVPYPPTSSQKPRFGRIKMRVRSARVSALKHADARRRTAEARS